MRNYAYSLHRSPEPLAFFCFTFELILINFQQLVRYLVFNPLALRQYAVQRRFDQNKPFFQNFFNQWQQSGIFAAFILAGVEFPERFNCVV